MDKIGLALMGKIIKLYENTSNTDQFVSFRKIPMTYTSKNFVFREEEALGIDALDAKHNMADFASLCNFIPHVSRFWEEKSTHLVQEYKAILDSATLPTSSLSAEDRQRLEDAKAFLQTDGVYENYKSHREKYFETQEKINDYKLKTFDAETDEERQLLNNQIQLLTEKLESIEDDWVLEGKKREVEETTALIDELESKGISTDWQDAKTKVADDGGIVQIDPLTMVKIYPTFYSPKDFYKEDTTSGWAKISLKQNEIEQLSQFAMNSLFSGDHSDLGAINQELDIKEIKAEVTSLTIERPWFTKTLFERRDWKLANNEVISSGGEFPTGRMPAFIQGLLFVRNVEIDLVENSAKNAATIKKYQDLKIPIQLGPVLINTPEKKAGSIKKIKMSSKFNPKSADQFRKVVLDKKIKDLKSEKSRKLLKSKGLSGKVMAPTASEKLIKTRIPIMLDTSAMLRTGILIQAFNKFGYTGTITDDAGNPLQVNMLFTNLNNNARKNIQSSDKGKYTATLAEGSYRLKINKPGYEPYEKVLPHTQGEGIKTSTLNIELKKIVTVQDELNEQHQGYLLLGYICKKNPLCPNPDPTLEWPGDDEDKSIKEILDDFKEDPLSVLDALLKSRDKQD